ncbi:MAG: hypothetical protein M1837_000546 [Sclerophora amabilis]|nr:MAG: hypothetical protein M1837_000546 [Sclerophora amabilis]
MRAIQVKEYVKRPEDLQVVELADPTPHPDQYLIRIHAAATNFFDLLQIRGKYQHQPPLPWISGSEFAGDVLKVPSQLPGGKTPTFQVGDRVFGASQGAYATVVAAKEGALRPVPKGWSYLDAAGLFVTAPTSYAGLVTRAKVQKGEYVLVHAAAGGVGLAAVQIAKALGATVIATAGTKHKLDVAKSFGADHAVDYTKPTWPEEVRKLTPKGRGVDVVYDPVGMITNSMKCTAWNGRLIVIGFAAGEIEKVAMNRVLLKNVSIIGLHLGMYTTMEPETVESTWKGLFELMETGKFRGTVFTDEEFVGLERVPAALKALGARETWGKVVVKVPQEGQSPKVLHQVPDGSITPSPTSDQVPLFDFELISSFLIPRQEFCDRLVSITTNRHRILGHPVCISNRKYARNELMFNFAIVLEENKDMSSYVTVVRKLAKLFRTLEEHGDFLSQELDGRWGGMGGDGGIGMGAEGRKGGVNRQDRGKRGKIYALCEIILEDLNNYCECMIPIDESNTINIKLFPLYPPPPPVKSWHVPLSTVRLDSLMDENWDLTMQKIVPFIDGINSIRRISELADADYNLVKSCIEHLLYYRTLLLLPPHHFSAVFAPTSDLPLFLSSPSMQAECASYVSTSTEGFPIPTSRLIALYSSLRHGQSLKQWCMEQGRDGHLEGIDLRRFVTFGLIKGLLYRVHKWVIKGGASAATALTGGSNNAGGNRIGGNGADDSITIEKRRKPPASDTVADIDANNGETSEYALHTDGSRAQETTVTTTAAAPPPGRTTTPNPSSKLTPSASFDTHTPTHLYQTPQPSPPPPPPPSSSTITPNPKSTTALPKPPALTSPPSSQEPTKTYLDGTHPLDEICTDLQGSERQVLARLKAGVGYAPLGSGPVTAVAAAAAAAATASGAAGGGGGGGGEGGGDRTGDGVGLLVVQR